MSVQAAIDAAIMNPGNDEVRIALGTFSENLQINSMGSGETIEISGGWDPSFSNQSLSSVIDGGLSDRVVNIDLNSGDNIILRNLVFQNGQANPGAGLLITQRGSSMLRIENCEIINNIADSARSEGAGIRASVLDDSQFELRDCLVDGNQALCSGNVDCRGGGMDIAAENNAVISVENLTISNNVVSIASGSGISAGARLLISGASSLTFNDNLIIGNTVTATSSSGNGVGLSILGSGTITARRNTIYGNMAVSPSLILFAQVNFVQFGNSVATLSDTLIANGNSKGILASSSGGNPELHLINLTVADHVNTGIQLNSTATGGTTSLSNSIAVDNGPNSSLGATILSANNLLSGSADFVDPGTANYALNPGSAAVDAGTNTPLGGLSASDINGQARVFNAVVDIGAFEFDSENIFFDSFE